MDPAVRRLAAALLTQNPGSELVEQASSALVLSVPQGGVRAMVVVLDPTRLAMPLGENVAALVSRAQLGIPMHVVVVHPETFDARTPLEENIKPQGLQMKQIGGWSWVPGRPIESVRGPALPGVKAAADYANAHPELSLEHAAETVQRETGKALDFQAAVMTRKPVVSWAIAAVCVVFFGLQYHWGQGLPVLAAARMGAEIPSRVLAGEWWRLFSVMLLHGSVFHLAMNMLALLSFGPFLERLIGSSRYLTLYVLSGLGGSLLSLTRGGDGIGVGASGGVWGLMVAGAVLVTWPRGLIPSALAHQLRQRAWTPVGINLLYSFQPGIDMLAHLGGGLAGAALIYLLTRGAAPEKPLARTVPSTALGVVVGLLLASSMGFALAEGQPWALTSKWNLQSQKLGDTGLSLLVPEGWRSQEASAGTFHWGSLNETGAEVIVEVQQPVEEPVDDVGAALDATVRDLEGTLPPGFTYTQKPQRKKLPSGKEVAFCEMRPQNKEDVRFLWQWWSLEGGNRWVMVLTNSLDSTSDERRRQLVEMADSLR
jgi:membrane associated rhomboid family serine protease